MVATTDVDGSRMPISPKWLPTPSLVACPGWIEAARSWRSLIMPTDSSRPLRATRPPRGTSTTTESGEAGGEAAGEPAGDGTPAGAGTEVVCSTSPCRIT